MPKLRPQNVQGPKRATRVAILLISIACAAWIDETAQAQPLPDSEAVNNTPSANSSRRPKPVAQRRSRASRLVAARREAAWQWVWASVIFAGSFVFGAAIREGVRRWGLRQMLRQQRLLFERMRSAEREILQQACALMTPATAMLEIPDRVLPVRFQEMTPQGLDLRLDKPVPRTALKRGVSACVQLVTPEKGYLFLCKVYGFRTQGGQVNGLRLTLPDNVAQADSRRFVRYLVPGNCPLQVWFRVDDHFVEVTALDISMGGLLVESPLSLKAGVGIDLRMVLGDSTVEGPCAIRRASGKTLGLSFGSKDKPLDTASRGKVRTIVEQVEALGVKNKTN